MYSENFAFTTGTAGITGTAQEMRLNSLFDPNATGVGHQPYGYDTYSALYGRYKVSAVTVDLLFTTPGSAADVCCVALVQPPSGGLNLTGLTIDRCIEMPQIANAHLSSTGSRTARIRRRFMLHDVFGITKQQFDANVEDYEALISASPARAAILAFSVCSYSGAGGQAVSAQLTLCFEVAFFDRIQQGQS